MGDLRNGGSPPEDGLPGLPPEWGEIVIPDDLSELDGEVRAVRRELRRGAVSVADREPVALRVPIVIMVVAVLMALVSLFVMTWGRPPVRRGVPVVSLTASTTSVGWMDLSDVVLRDAAGSPTTLEPYFPAVILLMNGCDCPDLVREVAETVPPTVTVVVVGPVAPSAILGNVRLLIDPGGRLSSLVGPAPVSGATAIVVDAGGRTVTTARGVRTAAEIGPITVG
jgi:hypothetical protein